jgi:intraflagellar transport protein 56
LSGYETFDPESIFTANLKACNNYQVYSGKNAEEVLRPVQQKFKGGDLFKESDLLRHNLVVFRGGENAMQILPPLIELFPETRLNMVIYCLKNESTEEAFNLVKDLNPTNPREYIIKAVALLQYGHKKDSREHLKSAQQLFQIVGASATECDTIPGRQCMASCFFLLKQFDDVLVYLNSIKSYFQSDDDFHWNYALATAATGDYKEAEQSFLLIRN